MPKQPKVNKKTYLALGNLILSFKDLKSKHFSQFFWWNVNLRGLREFILQKVQASVVERQKKKFCYPSLSFGKEDARMIILSASDRSRDSTAKRNLSVLFFTEKLVFPLFSTVGFRVEIERPWESFISKISSLTLCSIWAARIFSGTKNHASQGPTVQSTLVYLYRWRYPYHLVRFWLCFVA